MIDWLVTPLSYGFMQRGLVAALMVGVLCAIVGCYVVLRSMSFLGDALAHAILPGLAIAYLLNANLMIGALFAAIVVALLIGFISRQGTIKEDTAIGILFAAALSLGVALISSIKSYALDLTHILFGNILGISSQDLVIIAVLSAIVLATVVILYKEFLVVSFDPILASTLRLPVTFLRNLILILLALAIVVSIETVGVGLVAAMLVTPATTAYLLTRRLPAMMLVSAVIGAVSCVIGLFLSFYVSVASGAAIVLVATGIFLVVYLFAPERGVVRAALRERRAGAGKTAEISPEPPSGNMS
jgi:manganese/iron transport system permease protein